ncbi:hypothetical protein GCM10022284_64410 [Streptomyces hundungensis]
MNQPPFCSWPSGALRGVFSDDVGGIHLMSRIATPTLARPKHGADSGYRTIAINHGARLGIDIVQRERWR